MNDQPPSGSGDINADAVMDGAAQKVTVDADCEDPSSVNDPQRWAQLATAALRACGVTHGRLDLSFVGADSMAELNQTHMDVVGPTDVLSFPIDAVDTFGVVETLDLAAGEPDNDLATDELPTLLGDIVICPEMAQANAAAAERGVEDELALLVVHGVLHIMGLDHLEADERSHMQARERELLMAFHDPNPSTHWAPATETATTAEAGAQS